MNQEVYIVREGNLKGLLRTVTTDIPEQQQGPPPFLNSLMFGGGKLEPRLMLSKEEKRFEQPIGGVDEEMVSRKTMATSLKAMLIL